MRFSVSRCKLVTITIEKSTVNNELNTTLFRNDNLHLSRGGYEKLSKLFINNIKSVELFKQKTVTMSTFVKKLQ